jgi:hypothetical protein
MESLLKFWVACTPKGGEGEDSTFSLIENTFWFYEPHSLPNYYIYITLCLKGGEVPKEHTHTQHKALNSQPNSFKLKIERKKGDLFRCW